jgi:hypothetical protein
LPPLELPRQFAVLPFLSLGSGLIVSIATRSAAAALIGGTAFIPLLLGLMLLELTCGYRVPARCQTVGQLATVLMPSIVRSDHAPWTENDVWQVIRRLTADCAGIPVSQIKRDTHFIRDLC